MDIQLIQQHCPVFYHDKYEREPLINMNEYVINKQEQQDNSCTAVVVDFPGKTLIHYFFFYPKDNGLRKLGVYIDAHKYDLEHVIVELAQDKVSGVCYLPHGSAEFFWVRGSDLDKLLVNEKQPKVYASRDKHGSYPLPGTIRRYFNFADDHNIPVEIPIKAVPAAPALMAVDLIDGKFPAIRSRIGGDFSQYPVISLAKVYVHLLFKVPVEAKPFLMTHRVVTTILILCIIALIFTIIALVGSKK